MADDEQHEHKVEQADAGASLTEPRQCSSLRKNQSVVIKGRPCKIVDMSTSKTGKHGHAKVHLVGIDLFTGKKLEELCPSTHNMDVPHVTSRTYTLLDIADDDYMHLYDEKEGTELTHIKVPEGKIGEDIRKMAEETPLVTILSAMGEEAAMKVDKNTQV